MILQWLAELFYTLFDLLLGWIHISPLPDDVNAIADYIGMIITNGGGIVAFFIPMSIVKVCIIIILSFMTIIDLYYIVMWILKKIPMAGVS